MAHCTISEIVEETCDAIYEILRPVYLKMPDSPDEWKQISNEFWTKWQIANVVGALDGKHVQIKKPPKSGSLHFNYKG
jgi:hypothetical protein